MRRVDHYLRASNNITPHYIHERYHSRKSNLDQTYNVYVYVYVYLSCWVNQLGGDTGTDPPRRLLEFNITITSVRRLGSLGPDLHTNRRTCITYNKYTAKWWSDTGDLETCRRKVFPSTARNLHNRQFRPVARSLSAEAAKSLVQAFISCRLDYCNVMLYGTSDTVRALTVNLECSCWRERCETATFRRS